jgi:hypothetical protein
MFPGTRRPTLTDMPAHRLAATVVAGLLASLTVSACAAVQRAYDSDRTETATLTEIALSGGTGSLTVQPGSGPGTVIKRHIRYQRRDRPVPNDRTEGGVLRIDTDCGPDCVVDYVVVVPNRVKVSGASEAGAVDLRSVGTVALEVGTGSVTINGAEGTVSVRTGDGAVEVFDATGNVTARTGSGAVRVHRAGGAVTASSHAGQVEVRDTAGDRVTVRSGHGAIGVVLNRPQSVQATSDEGAIKVTVPGGAPFDVRAAARHGRSRVEVPVTTGAPNLLDLTTDRGEIAVVPA